MRSLVGLVLVPVLLAAAAMPALADGGRCGDRHRPACSILRPPDLSFGVSEVDPLKPDCVVLVGGFGSATGDDTFDELLRWADDDPRYTIVRFGRDLGERFPFDTTGPLDVSAEDLRGLVRAISPTCGATHVVSHSMGGAVADRAFALGFAPGDHVITYIALSGPHNGATLARALRPAIESDPLIAVEASAIARTIHVPDPTTVAAAGLARTRAPDVLPRVAHVRLRLANDLMVLRRDNMDRRVDVRELLPTLGELEGHGGILHSARIADVIARAIAAHEILPDARSPAARILGDVLSRRLDAAATAAYADFGIYLRSGAEAEIALAEGELLALAVTTVANAIGPRRREE